MNWQNLPPVPALRAFAAFVDKGSLTAAGAALNVSHAAISQQLRHLERHLDLTLFDRTGRSLTLTPAGEQLAAATTAGFQRMIDVVEELTGADADRPLHVSTTPNFAVSWLMPRLPDFRARHPDIDIMIDPALQLVTLAPGGIDIAIRYGDGNWPGLDSEPLLNSPMVVVAAPSLMGTRTVDSPADLASAPWVEELGTSEATRWLAANGVEPDPARRRMALPGNMMLDAARDGQGVAVAVRSFVEGDLAAGRLVALFTAPRTDGYHIVTRPGVLRPPVKAFLKWLRHQKSTGVQDHRN